MERKIQKHFVDEGFGFPVHLLNAPMVKVRGVWTPDIDYDKLAKAVLRLLAYHPSRLTGAEIKFVRQHFGMTLQQFAKRFGVSHVAVIKWERNVNKATSMNWATEKDIRLFVLLSLAPTQAKIIDLYTSLEEIPSGKPVKIEVPAEELLAA